MKKNRWSGKIVITTADDRFVLVESLLAGDCGSSIFFNGKSKNPKYDYIVRQGLDVHIDLVEHITKESGSDFSIWTFRFEGHDRCSRNRVFRGRYDFIRKTGWIQCKYLV